MAEQRLGKVKEKEKTNREHRKDAGPNKIRKSQVEGTDFLFLIGHS